MSNVDPIRIRDLLGNIAESLRRLRQLGDYSEAKFLADFRNTESAKYLDDLDAFQSAIIAWLNP